MTGMIYGLGGLPEPVEPTARRAPGLRSDSPPPSSASDEVSVSEEMQAASRAIQSARNAEADKILAERIRQAKENVEKGTYRVQQIVEQVAARISQYISVDD